jgi:tetratricopeptide (TPR) repeat protein
MKCESDWDWRGAERDYRRALQINPGYAMAHYWFGSCLSAMGRLEEGLAGHKQALDLDPTSPWINAGLVYTYYYAGRYDEAIAQARKALEIDPNFPTARHALGLAYLQKSMFREAIAELEKGTLGGRRPVDLADLGYAYAVAGRRREVMKVLDELQAIAKREHVPADRWALLYAGLGDREQAFRWLEKAHQERSGELYTLKVDPRFDSLRSDARFQSILRRMGLEP